MSDDTRPDRPGRSTESDAKAPITGAMPEGESAPDAGTKPESADRCSAPEVASDRDRGAEATAEGAVERAGVQRRGDRDPAGHVRRARHRRHLRLRRTDPDDRVPGRRRCPRTAGGGTRSTTGSVQARAELLRRDRRRSSSTAARSPSTSPAAHLATLVQHLRDDAHLRFEFCSSVSGVHYPADKGARAARGLPPAVDDPQPPDPARGLLPRRRPAHPVGGADLPDRRLARA